MNNDIYIITKMIDECADMVTYLKAKRGTTSFDELKGVFVADQIYNDDGDGDWWSDIQKVHHIAENKRGSLAILKHKFCEYMRDENIDAIDKDWLYGQMILKFSSTIMVTYATNDQILTIDAWDEQSGYDLDDDGEMPNLDDYFSYSIRYPEDKDMGIFYKYTYYIAYISEEVSSLLHRCREFVEEDIITAPQLKCSLTDAQRERLFTALTEPIPQMDNKTIIDPNTDKASFLWAMGGSVPPKKFVGTQWLLKNQQMLREFILCTCDYEVKVNGGKHLSPDISFTGSKYRNFDLIEQIFGKRPSKKPVNAPNLYGQISMQAYIKKILHLEN
ncbi:MAG: hypothetical protein SNI51_08220 [Rikenellaceae bacterium]